MKFGVIHVEEAREEGELYIKREIHCPGQAGRYIFSLNPYQSFPYLPLYQIKLFGEIKKCPTT